MKGICLEPKKRETESAADGAKNKRKKLRGRSELNES